MVPSDMDRAWVYEIAKAVALRLWLRGAPELGPEL